MRGRAVAAAALMATLVPAGARAAGGADLLRVLAGPIASAKAADATLLLPPALPGVRARLYGSGGMTASGYDLQVAYAPGCHDANACFVADFRAGPGRLRGGVPVTLAGGRRGVFAASRCGASCNPATISWRQFGLRYSITFTGGRRTLVALADAAIAAGPR